jgi:hypothetical protein
MRKRMAVAVSAAALGLGVAMAPAAHADGHGPGWYNTWASGVNIRANSSATCNAYPSPANCPTVRTTVSPADPVYIYCQEVGQTVGGNPYWVYVWSKGYDGWMASYYIDVVTNWIDGVPYCGS